MKNSASELYTIDHATAYQHAFGYIRQLAILLRTVGVRVDHPLRKKLDKFVAQSPPGSP